MSNRSLVSAASKLAGYFFDGERRTLKVAGVALLLLTGAFLLYGRTLGYSWSYDDFVVIVENPDVASWSGFLTNTFPGRPLRELSYLLDYRLFGLRPGWWHVQSIAWHALNVTLAGLLALRLGASRRVAGAVALLLLVHPLNVEVVANLSHRKDGLALAFCLLAALAYLRSFDGNGPWRWRIIALLGWGVALTAKQNALLLLPVLMVWEAGWVPRDERLLWRRPWLVASGMTLALLAGGVWLLAGGGAVYREQAYRFLTRWHYYGPDAAGLYPLLVLKSWAFMGSRLFWPTPLAVEYNYPLPTSLLDPWVLGGVLLALGWLGALLFARRRQRLIWFGLAWFGLFWLPTSNLWPLAYFAADRYFYLPAFGIFLAAAVAVESVAWRPLTVIGAIVICVFTLLAIRQVPVWKDDETLYLHALVVSPRSAFICNELGKLYQRRGEPATALRYYLRGAEADPRQASLPFNLGTLYESQGLQEQALGYYRRFFELEPAGAYAAAAAQLRARLRQQYGVTIDEPKP